MASAVANRYAHALVDIVMAPNSPLKPEEASAQLASVDALIQESAELQTALMTPAIPTGRKRAVMAKLLERTGAAPLIRNFIYVVIDHRRISVLGEIKEAFESQLDERRGYVRAEVSSAAPLSEQLSAGLQAELSKLTGKRMRLKFQVDPSLVGGVVARIGSKVYDGSVRGDLQELRRKLAGHISE